jgi:hypothetical protein
MIKYCWMLACDMGVSSGKALGATEEKCRVGFHITSREPTESSPAWKCPTALWVPSIVANLI